MRKPTALDLEGFERAERDLRDLATWTEHFGWPHTTESILAAADAIEYAVQVMRDNGTG